MGRITNPVKPRSSVVFTPWRGRRYRARVPRLLVVGEAHYDWESRRVPRCDVTNKVVSDVIQCHLKGIFPKYIATCIGHWPSPEEQKEFLQATAFYNYIQCFVGDRARKRPTPEMWKASERAFGVVLRRLKPQLILVLGIDTWNHLPELDGRNGAPLTRGKGRLSRFNDTWLYPVGENAFALAIHVGHPAWGYNFRKFSLLFEQAQNRVLSGRM